MTTFAIDFDGTFTADPELFETFVAILRARGHRCVMITGRRDEGKIGSVVRGMVKGLMPIIFSDGLTKREAARLAGYDVDIWIEDMPEAVDTAHWYVGDGSVAMKTEKEIT